MFNLIEMLFPIMFILIFIIIVFTFVKGIATWFKNNNSPRLTVSARIVAKRQNTTHNNQPNAGDISGAHGFHTISSTSYYVTFQVDSGDRMELMTQAFCSSQARCPSCIRPGKSNWRRAS